MKIKDISVSKGVTISVGKFESVRLDAAITIQPSAEDDYDVVYDTAQEIVSSKIMAQVIELKPIIDKGSFVHELTEGTIRKKTKPKSRRRQN